MSGKHEEIEINRNSMKDVQTLPGADTDSDHNLMVAKICTRWEDGEEDIRCCWITLKRSKDNGS
jgi:hypothetical protein